jgi:methyl-accepting chemotaxis protein
LHTIQENIKRINEKLQRLVKDHQGLQKENEKQAAQIAALLEKREKDTETIQGLQEQVAIMKAVAGQMTDKDKATFENNINRYIREIDKCIGLLSE